MTEDQELLTRTITLFDYVQMLIRHRVLIVIFTMSSSLIYLILSFTTPKSWTSEAVVWSSIAQVVSNRAAGQEMANLIKLQPGERITTTVSSSIVRIVGESKNAVRSISITRQALHTLVLEDTERRGKLQKVVSNLSNSILDSSKAGKIDEETIRVLITLRSVQESPTLVVIDLPTTATEQSRRILYGLATAVVASVVFSALIIFITEWWKAEKELRDKSKS